MSHRPRLLHVQRSSVLLLAAMLGVALAPFPQTVASASCAAPYLEMSEQPVLDRGASAVVEGRAFADGCRDNMSCSDAVGCDSCEYNDPPVKPLEGVELRLVQPDRSWSLGIVDADTAENNRQGWVTWHFEVPVGAEPGPARLVADHAQPVRIRIR